MFLPAHTLAQLETEIEYDYGNNPVLSECESLDAARSYLTAEPASPPEDTDDLRTQTVRAAEAITRRAGRKPPHPQPPPRLVPRLGHRILRADQGLDR